MNNEQWTMNDGHILFQVRLSVFVIPDLIRRHPELDSSSWTWFRTVVCRNVDSLRVNSSVLNQVQDDESSLGWRITDCLDWKRVLAAKLTSVRYKTNLLANNYRRDIIYYVRTFCKERFMYKINSIRLFVACGLHQRVSLPY